MGIICGLISVSHQTPQKNIVCTHTDCLLEQAPIVNRVKLEMRGESCDWMDDEVEFLLPVTVEHKNQQVSGKYHLGVVPKQP